MSSILCDFRDKKCFFIYKKTLGYPQRVKGAGPNASLRRTHLSCLRQFRSDKKFYTPDAARLCTQEVGTAQFPMGQNI